MSKLNKIEKSTLKQAKADFFYRPCASLLSFPNTGLTIAACREFPNAKMLQVSVSVMSDSEPKFRRKVGKREALIKMFNKEITQFPVDTGNEDAFLETYAYFIKPT